MPNEPGKRDRGISIALLQQGDAQAFALFVNHYQDMVFACCRAAGLSGQDMEDAAAETFLAAWKSIGKFKGTSKLSSWLWSIAWRRSIDSRRKNKSAALLEEPLRYLSAVPTTSADPVEQNELSDCVWQAVSRLSPPQAAAIVLCFREQKSTAEIAEILRMPENTVKTHLHRARKELYIQLQSVWRDQYVTK